MTLRLTATERGFQLRNAGERTLKTKSAEAAAPGRLQSGGSIAGDIDYWRPEAECRGAAVEYAGHPTLPHSEPRRDWFAIIVDALTQGSVAVVRPPA